MKEDIKRGLIIVLIALAIFIVVFLVTSLREKSITGYAGRYGYLNFTIMPSNITLQAVMLPEGWNFISFNVEPVDKSITSVLAPIEGKYSYLLEWDSENQEFRVWSEEGTKEFTKFNMNKSYFIFLKEDAIMNLSGSRFGNFNLTLLTGWEAPNYPYEYNASVSGNTFYNINFSYMMIWDVASQEFKIYSIYSSNPEFNKISAGEGYFIHTEGGTLEYARA